MEYPLVYVSLVASSVAFVATLYLFFQIRRLNHLRDTFFTGNKAVDLEELLHSIARHIVDLEKNIDKQSKELSHLEHVLGFAVQKIGVVRFNPFGDDGGNLSFCVALLDSHNSGIVLTSMHGREQNRIYSKRLENGKSEVQLTQEEVQAVQLANTKNN